MVLNKTKNSFFEICMSFMLNFIENALQEKLTFLNFANLNLNGALLQKSQKNSVCKCIMHQDVKLMPAGVSLKTDKYKTLIKKTVCYMESKECMLYVCKECYGQETSAEYLWQIIIANDIDPDFVIEFHQWFHTDRYSEISGIVDCWIEC